MNSVKDKCNNMPKQNHNESKISIIPNTAPYKFMRGLMCFLTVSLSMLYLIFSCSFAIKYRPLVFDNILTETIKGTIKGSNGEYIQWIATIPTGLVSRTVAIICVVMFLIFGVYTMLFSFYTACKKYKFIQPWHFMLLSAMSCVGGLISIFLSNKFAVVEEFTHKKDCLLQSVVSNDCSVAIGNDEIYAYDICKAVESFCLDENASMSRYYTKAIIVAVVSFIVSVLSFAYGIVLLKLKMKYSKKLALINEKNAISEKTKLDLEMSNSSSICQYDKDNSGINCQNNQAGTGYSTADNTNVVNSTKTNVYYPNMSNDSCKAIQPYQNEMRSIPMGIVVTTTTSKQCHIAAHRNANSQVNTSNMGNIIGNSAISCVNSIHHSCHSGNLNHNRNAHLGLSLKQQYHHHHHHHHHHGPNHGNRQHHNQFL
ncbi:transmembrane domain-containing protein [Cryptosporidium hominis]